MTCVAQFAPVSKMNVPGLWPVCIQLVSASHCSKHVIDGDRGKSMQMKLGARHNDKATTNKAHEATTDGPLAIAQTRYNIKL